MVAGLLVGKFYPPHAGHDFLVAQAASQCDILVVLVCEGPSETIPASVRSSWLEEQFQGGSRVIFQPCPDPLPIDYDDEVVWRGHLGVFESYWRKHVDSIDVVFGSESYVEVFAEYLDAVPVIVDQARSAVSVSGTAVRHDLYGSWGVLNAAAAADLAFKVVVLGSESTGTSTLAASLQKHYTSLYDPALVLEYGRKLTEDKLAVLRGEDPSSTVGDVVWSVKDFQQIALKQDRKILSAGVSSPLVVCDTDALATRVWEERYLSTSTVKELGLPVVGDLYIVTSPVGVPFVDDGLRDGEHLRESMHRQFIAEVAASGKPWFIASGEHLDRLSLAVKTIDLGLRVKHSFGSSMDELTAAGSSA